MMPKLAWVLGFDTEMIASGAKSRSSMMRFGGESTYTSLRHSSPICTATSSHSAPKNACDTVTSGACAVEALRSTQ